MPPSATSAAKLTAQAPGIGASTIGTCKPYCLQNAVAQILAFC
jgi:hypothetical protein